MPLYKLCLQAQDAGSGHAAALLLQELAAGPAALAVTLFEQQPAGFLIEAYYEGAPAVDAIERALADLAPRLGRLAVSCVPEVNWVALSQTSLPPVRAGRFIVHGSHDRARFAMRRLAIEIEAGEAFGTGYNATTAGCLAALDALVGRRGLARVLDLGCGSGVLAIAAARALPRASVVAVDNDPVAVAIAIANVRLNRAGARVAVLPGEGFAHPRLRGAAGFDLVLANILPGTLVALVRRMREALRPGGLAVLSGILTEQAREVRAAYRAAGFVLVRERRYGEWTVLTVERERRAQVGSWR